MNIEDLKKYLSHEYQGSQSFLENIIYPIFGEEEFVDGYEAEILDNYPEYRKMADATGIRSVKDVGMIYIDGEPLQIFDISVSDRIMMERNRVTIQSLVRRIMDQYSNAFMLFHYEDISQWNWRFTYCHKSANKEESTDSKRYTFLLGPKQSCRTAAENFVKLYEKRNNLMLVDIEDAFSVEALSDRFFNEYKEIYANIIFYITGKRMVKKGNKWEEVKEGRACRKILDEFCEFEDPEKAVRDYVKKLMGRLVFLQFLQKKGWLGVPSNKNWGEGDGEFIQHLFTNYDDQDNFIDDVLEKLFNDLNTERKDDISKIKILGYKFKVPYLNGGLFERDATDETYFPLPARYMEDMFEFFSRYNFTIDENDPDDAEVGVDPEMLGRIFENLLEDNKDKGAFYTPKEIVTYMCRESLIAYLQTGIEDEATKEALRQFVTTHDAEHLGTNKKFRQQVDDALKTVKICDPAIGSGAFPMGLLKELFLCRTAIEGIEQSKAAEIKKHIIQQNIYGVDIERGAVDIARLRFWLSLIVDEETPQALPNLDFKIMQGNSLLEQYKGVDLSTVVEKKRDGMVDMFEDMVDVLRLDLRKLLTRYYECTDHKEKIILRKKITDNVKQQLLEQGITVNFGDIDLAGNDQFMLWHTWFYDVFLQGGFDIVIGNPPYLFLSGKGSPVKRLEKEGKQEQALKLKKLLDTYGEVHRDVSKGCKDFYKWFYKIAFDICRFNGVQSYITPDTFLSMPKYSDLRQLIFQHSACVFVDLGFSVFEAPTVSSAIGIVRKNNINTTQTNYADIRAYLNKRNRYRIADIINETLQLVSVTNYDLCAYKNPIAQRFYTEIEMMPIGESLSFTEGEHDIQIDENKLFSSYKPSTVPVLVDSTMKRNGYVSKAYIISNIELNHTHEGDRCILRKTGDTINVSIPKSVESAIAHQNVYVVKDKAGFPMKFWMAILNSRMLSFLYQNGLWGQKGRTMAQFRIYALAALPIPQSFDKQFVKDVTECIDKILLNQDIDNQENKIDRLVYKLYGLNYDEVLIVDPETPITREEYEKEL